MLVVGEITKNSGVYKITCTVTGKMYVGSSVNCRSRLAQHGYDLRKQQHGSIRLQNAFLKYGENAFTFEMLELCSPDIRLEREQYWMDLLKSHDRDVGYNMSKTSQYPQYEATDEIRAKISERTKTGLAAMSDDSRERMIHAARHGRKALGVRHSDEFKKAQAERARKRESVRVVRSDGMVFDSFNEAAAYHDVHRKTIRFWCRGGLIKDLKWRNFTFRSGS